jgi:integrase
MRLPRRVIKLLKQAHKNKKSERWIFADERGEPRDHFLRNLKFIALRAGLNCGQCKTTLSTGHGKYKKRVAVTCATHPVCEHIYLHRFRKLCATRWSTPHGGHQAVPIRTIQHWLGHKNLETTMLYLGITDTDELSASVNAAYGD